MRYYFFFNIVDELKCPLYLSAVNYEAHFVLCCPSFDDLRYELISQNMSITQVHSGWHCFLSYTKGMHLKNPALYVYKVVSRRKSLLSLT